MRTEKGRAVDTLDALRQGLFALLFVLFIWTWLAGWVSWGLGLGWNRSYFTKGWIMRSVAVGVPLHHTDLPSMPRLESLLRDGVRSSVVFHQMAPDVYAFRPKPFEFSMRWAPITGTLLFDQQNNRVVVRARLHWWELPIAAFFITLVMFLLLLVPFERMALLATVCVPVLVAATGLPSWYRFSGLAERAAAAWSRQYRSARP